MAIQKKRARRSLRRPAKPASPPMRWRNRLAHSLSNGVLELIVLKGGGHIACLHFAKSTGKPDTNVLWQAPWRTYEPGSLSASRLKKKFGSSVAAKFLSSATGHVLCLDYFGPPSQKEAAKGLPLHGEAASRNWKLNARSYTSRATTATWTVELPAAGLSFVRTITLPANQSVAVFRETIRNRRTTSRDFHWVQHVTLGPPFLSKSYSRLFLSGHRGMSWPHGYEGKSLLKSASKFSWPSAPREHGSVADLAVPFLEKRTGYVACVLLDQSRKVGYIAALNWHLGILAGYCFRTADFPWVAVWEENSCRSELPWSRTTQARGMEFGTTPMPVGKDEMFQHGKVLGKNGWTRIVGKASRSTAYVAFLTSVPKNWRTIRNITLKNEVILIQGPRTGELVSLRATGAGE
jgi:hypothetical protein